MSSPRLAPWLMPDTISSGGALDQAERGEAHAVHRRAVGGEAAGAVAELHLLDPERVAGRDARAGGAAVRVGRDHRQLDAGQLEQRPPHHVQAGGGDAVVVGQQDSHRGSLKGMRRSPGRARAAAPSPPPRCAGGPPAARRSASGLDALEHRPDQDPDHVAHERVGLDPEGEHVARLLDPLGAEHVALEAHVVGLGRREGGEVVGADERRGAGVERVAVERPRPPERPPLLERARRAARVAGGSGRCASARRGGRRSRRAPPRWRSTATSGGSSAFRLRSGAGSPSWLATCPRACTPRSVRPATVSAHLAAQHGGERLLDTSPAPCAAPGWRRPAGELRAVVLEQQPGGRGATRACAPRSGRTRSRARSGRRRRAQRSASSRASAASCSQRSGGRFCLRGHPRRRRGAERRRPSPPASRTATAACRTLDLEARGQPVEALAHRRPRPTTRPTAAGRPAAARSCGRAGTARRRSRAASRPSCPTVPPGRTTRNSSSAATRGRGAIIAPNTEPTQSKRPSSNGSASTSASTHSMS